MSKSNLDTVTIDGVTMTIDAYLEKQEREKESTNLQRAFKSESGKYSYSAHRSPKPKSSNCPQQGVIWTRKYSKADVRRLKMKELSKKRQLMNIILDSKGEWFTHKMLHAKMEGAMLIGGVRVNTLRMYEYLNEKGVMERRYRGRVAEYKIHPAVIPYQKDCDELYNGFMDWSRKRYIAKKRPLFEDKKSVEKMSDPISPAVNVKNRLEQATGIQLEVSGKVDINVNVTFKLG